jgi:ATP phosphoribosyltransferase regulatory subunit
LQVGGVTDCLIDLADVRIADALLNAVSEVETHDKANIYAALASKDTAALQAFPDLLTLLSLYGGLDVLAKAREKLPPSAAVTQSLDSLQWLTTHLIANGIPAEAIRFDLSDLGGYGYYTGVRFALYSSNAKDALLRGGRYDEVGAVFGRKRPAVGFSLDIKALVDSAKPHAPKAAIRAPWGTDAALAQAIRGLRASGETVICILPGHESEADEFACDRELVLVAGRWTVKALVIPA